MELLRAQYPCFEINIEANWSYSLDIKKLSVVNLYGPIGKED